MSPPTDAHRNHRARQEVHSERDKLLKKADKRIDLGRFMPSDGKDRARALVIAAPMAVLGMCPYVVMVLLWFLVWYKSVAETGIAFASMAVVGVLCCVGSSPRMLGKDRPWLWWFGAVWLQALLVGLLVGFFLYFRDLAYYWKYEEMPTYTNVAAAQDASAFGDGSMFLFAEDSRIDAKRAVGFKSRWTGQTYCVAPVTDVTMNQASDIYYWAVGDNCCSPRAEFLCDDAADGTTRSALRVLEPEDVARPFMRWAVRGANYPKYIEAVRLQEATYFTKAATRPTLLYWTKDPIAFKDSFYNSARDLCVQVSLAYFALVATGAYLVAWRLVPQQKSEGAIRHGA